MRQCADGQCGIRRPTLYYCDGGYLGTITPLPEGGWTHNLAGVRTFATFEDAAADLRAEAVGITKDGKE